MRYCVIKDTITIIDGSNNSDEIMRGNALSAGITDFEILTEEQFKNRVQSLPKETPQPSIEERLAEKDREISRLQTQNELINADLAALMDALTESGVI